MAKLTQMIEDNQPARVELARRDYYAFFHIYFSHYILSESASFHRVLCEMLSDSEKKMIEIIGFRGSAKSVYATLGYPIWSMINSNSHFTLLISDSFSQIKTHIYNLKNELETNKLLINDFGPFETSREDWTKTDIIVPKYDTRIVARSAGQKVRGIIYKQWRPQLIIADDIEDLKTVNNKDIRDKIYNWFKGEVLPLGEKKTKVILIGNLLHGDSLMSRIKHEIDKGDLTGEFKEFPLLDNNKITWKGRYPSMEDIEKKRKEVGDVRTWQREYLLKILSDEEQLFKYEWIQYYDKIDANNLDIYIGVDPAISQKETAHNFVLMVIGVDRKGYIYVLDYLRKRLTVDKQVDAVLQKYLQWKPLKIGIENVAYQEALQQLVQKESREKRIYAPIIGIRTDKDKIRRAGVLSTLFESGIIYLKREMHELIDELTQFPKGEKDDMFDGLDLAITTSKKAREKTIVTVKADLFKR